MEQTLGVNFIEDNDMIIEQIKDFSVPALVIFDDMLNSENLKAIAQLFTVFGRHLNLCLAFLTQRLFKNNEFFRQISQNSDYMCVFKNPRNSREISTLASRLRRWSLFYNDGMVMFFFQGTIAIDGFSMVLPSLDHHH